MNELEQINQRLERIENLLESSLASLKTPPREKHFYSTGEVAQRLGLSPWYVRRLCASGDILAEKHPTSGHFLVSADELERIESRRDALED